jgi:hypothetical protein
MQSRQILTVWVPQNFQYAFKRIAKIHGLFCFTNKHPSCMQKNNYLSFSLVSYVYAGFLRVCNRLHTNEVYNHEKDSATATVKTNSSYVLFIVLSFCSSKLVVMKKKSKCIAISYRLAGMIIIMQSLEENRFFHRNINRNKYFQSIKIYECLCEHCQIRWCQTDYRSLSQWTSISISFFIDFHSVHCKKYASDGTFHFIARTISEKCFEYVSLNSFSILPAY